MSASAEEIRETLIRRNAEHATEYYLLLTEDQVTDLGSGYVPNAVKAMARSMLEWAEDDRRAAARPVKSTRARVAPSLKPEEKE